MNLITDWNGKIFINGKQYESFPDLSQFEGEITIKLVPSTATTAVKAQDTVSVKAEHKAQDIAQEPANAQYKITVRQYMTRKSTPEFDFMAKFNNDVPMPYRVMTGTIEKETRGMYYMKLHADIFQERTSICMCCGRRLTNEVSQYFGVGPECGGHAYVNPFETKEELHDAVAEFRKKLQSITWEGWVIKSAITSKEIIDV